MSSAYIVNCTTGKVEVAEEIPRVWPTLRGVDMVAQLARALKKKGLLTQADIDAEA